MPKLLKYAYNTFTKGVIDMKKLLSISLVALLILIFNSSVSAVAQIQHQAQKENLTDFVEIEATDEAEMNSPGYQVQIQNQTATQNQGEDQQLQNANQEQAEKEMGAPSSTPNRSQTARKHMSEVAKQVEKLLDMESDDNGIGQQVHQIAQEQNQVQNQIESALGKVEKRQNWLRWLIGPNYQALSDLEAQLEQNQNQVEALNKVKNQLENQAEQSQLQQAIEAINQQNTALKEQIQTQAKQFSLFGWVVRLFR